MQPLPDGSGGWYIGGNFSQLGSVARNNIARINADGSVNAWNPDADGTVNTIALNGSTVYAGGSFTTIGGQTRNNIAALDIITGTATAWNADADGTVNTIELNGSTVYAGGSFTTIGAQTRNNLAALDATTGSATAWDPNAGGPIYTIAISGSTIYAGGAFTTIGAQTRNNIAALDAITGLATTWNPSANNTPTVYVAGAFDNIGGQARKAIASLDATTGSATSWNANARFNLHTVAANALTVYAGGWFSNIGGVERPFLAALNTGILPLHFLSFTATARREATASVFCKWTTADEQNTSHFIIERSADGRSYSGIGVVAATGNSTSMQQYTFTDNNPLASSAWYRIKQVDRDGTFINSKAVLVSAAGNTTTLRLYPNPVQQDATLMITATEKEYVIYTIFDNAGRRVTAAFVNLEKGSNSINLPLQVLMNGVYTIKLSGIKTNKQIQFVKQ